MFVQPTEVSLRWREVPCLQQNGPITGYVVRYYATCGDGDDRGIQWNKSVVTAGDIIDGLTPNIEYAFQVAAVNVNGTGPFSEPVTLGGNFFAVCVHVYRCDVTNQVIYFTHSFLYILYSYDCSLQDN